MLLYWYFVIVSCVAVLGLRGDRRLPRPGGSESLCAVFFHKEGGEEPKESDNLTFPHPTSTRLDEVRRGSQMSHVAIEPG